MVDLIPRLFNIFFVCMHESRTFPIGGFGSMSLTALHLLTAI